ncbi:MAG: CBS domain-containing protein [Candidatus Woesearchaeota archaeon]|nr:CBS domain-containing protein [Candidatus Woesearchaeota archaeon]
MKKILNSISEIKNKVKVDEIMTQSLFYLDEEDTAFFAIYTMGKEAISSIAVKKKDQLTGIFTERDVINRIVLQGKDPKKTKLCDVMTKVPKTISSDETVIKASNVMKNNKVRKLIVVDKANSPVGIISQTDIINSMQKIDDSYRTLLWNPKFSIIILAVIILMFVINYLIFRI